MKFRDMEKDLASKSKVNVIDISDSESDASDSEGVVVLEDGEGVLFNVDDEVDLRSGLLRDMLATDDSLYRETPSGSEVEKPVKATDDTAVDWDW